MKVFIEIECEDDKDLFLHLSVIRQQLKKEFKGNPDFEGVLEDGNCYGEHVIKVNQE